jgi:FKBP-type peptidyl-prolyl cis-trans isomerase (trigger factor)
MQSPYTYTIFRRSTALLACLLLVFFVACTKQDRDSQLAQQEKNIDGFIQGLIKGDTVAVYRPNSNRVILHHGLGDTLAPGDTAAFAYIGYVFSGGSGKGLLFATNLIEAAEDAGWALSAWPPDYGRNAVGMGYYIPGLDAGLVGMRLGEHAYIVFSAQHGFGNTEMGIVPKMSPLLFEVEVTEIIKKPKNN